MIHHVTNGAHFNEWLINKTGYSAVAFNEAMMSGEVKGIPFDDVFVEERALHHRVSKEDYMANMNRFWDVMNHLDEVDELVLWFGRDAFCQMNLLTIYKTLSVKGYDGIVKTVIFDENEPWDLVLYQIPTETKWKEAVFLYDDVLIQRKKAFCRDEIMNHAIELYLDLHDEHGRLNQMIVQHSDLDEMSLVKLLMENSKEEGLSDIQAFSMIRTIRKQRAQ